MNMAADALARLARKQTELDDAKKDYHEILVERDEKIATLELQLKSVRAELSNTRKTKENLSKDVESYKSTAQDATTAKTKLEKDLKFQKDIADHDREAAESLRKDAVATEKKIKTHEEALRVFKKRASENAATIQELHKKVDTLEAEKETLQTANANLALQQEGTTSEVSHATQEFEQMFTDLGHELDLNGYVGHVRDLLSTGQLQRKESSLSLHRQLSPQKSDQELPSIKGSSLQDQLAAADDTSSEQSVPAAGDEDDDDPTLTELGLGRTWTIYDYFVHIQDQEKKIIELKRINEELRAKAQTDDATITTTDHTTQTDADDTTTKVVQPAPQALGFSSIQSVSTEPIKPMKPKAKEQYLGFSTIQSLDTEPIKAEPKEQNLGFSAIQSVDTEPIKPKSIIHTLGFSKGNAVDTKPIEKPVEKPFKLDTSQQWRLKLAEEKASTLRKRVNELEQQLEAAEDTPPMKAAPAEQNLSFSIIQSVDTKPIEPKSTSTLQTLGASNTSKASTKPTVKYIDRPIKTEPSKLPFSLKLTFFMLLTLYLFLLAAALGERYTWTSANDFGRRAIIIVGNGGVAGLFAPMLTAMDDLLGANSAMLG